MQMNNFCLFLAILVIDDDPSMPKAQTIIRLFGRLGLIQTGEFGILVMPVHQKNSNIRNTVDNTFYQMFLGGKQIYFKKRLF